MPTDDAERPCAAGLDHSTRRKLEALRDDCRHPQRPRVAMQRIARLVALDGVVDLTAMREGLPELQSESEGDRRAVEAALERLGGLVRLIEGERLARVFLELPQPGAERSAIEEELFVRGVFDYAMAMEGGADLEIERVPDVLAAIAELADDLLRGEPAIAAGLVAPQGDSEWKLLRALWRAEGAHLWTKPELAGAIGLVGPSSIDKVLKRLRRRRAWPIEPIAGNKGGVRLEVHRLTEEQIAYCREEFGERAR
jgi:hypothetical protein